MNKCHFIGNLTRDVEVKTTKNDKQVAKFAIAVNGRPYQKNGEQTRDVCFLDCEAWEKGAELISTHFGKGKPIAVHGELRFDRWEDNDGNPRSKHYLRVTEFDFLPGGKRDAGASGEGGDEPQSQPAHKAAAAPRKKAVKAAAPVDDDAGDVDGGVPVDGDDGQIPF